MKKQYSPTYPLNSTPVLAWYWSKEHKTAFPIVATWIEGVGWMESTNEIPIEDPVIGWSALPDSAPFSPSVKL
jgi:hypothetical protein